LPLLGNLVGFNGRAKYLIQRGVGNSRRKRDRRREKGRIVNSAVHLLSVAPLLYRKRGGKVRGALHKKRGHGIKENLLGANLLS